MWESHTHFLDLVPPCMDMEESIGQKFVQDTFHLKKNCRKFNIENKNIEKYAFFGKTIFLQGKNMSSTI
jgi:hypothetical protein